MNRSKPSTTIKGTVSTCLPCSAHRVYNKPTKENIHLSPHRQPFSKEIKPILLFVSFFLMILPESSAPPIITYENLVQYVSLFASYECRRMPALTHLGPARFGKELFMNSNLALANEVIHTHSLQLRVCSTSKTITERHHSVGAQPGV